MRTKQKNRSLVVTTLLLAVSSVSILGVSSTVSADPATTSVTCQDGRSKTADKTSKPDPAVLDEKDYEYACRNNGGYKAPDTTVTCKKDGVLNVYKDMADPKDKLDNKDKQVACEGHGGIKPAADDDEGADESVLSDPVVGDDCGGVKTAIIKCDAGNSGKLSDNGIWSLLLIIINVMAAGVGVLAVAGIVYGAILYTTAEDKADQVKQATDIITNVIIGLIIFALMWAGLNFIIPGGVFKT